MLLVGRRIVAVVGSLSNARSVSVGVSSHVPRARGPGLPVVDRAESARRLPHAGAKSASQAALGGKRRFHVQAVLMDEAAQAGWLRGDLAFHPCLVDQPND